MKCLGILLAGGNGTRLYPSTRVTSKQLVPVYDKPTAYYALSTLIDLGLNDILIICRSTDLDQYQNLFGTGKHLGITISYAIQDKANGIADAFNVVQQAAKDEFICNDYDQYVLILGDNIFCNSTELAQIYHLKNAPNCIFGVQVKDPSQYGVISRNKSKLVIEEKPKAPKSDIAVAGLYVFDCSVLDKVKKLKPSARNELEITDLIKAYIKENSIALYNLEYTTWFDTGTPDSLLDAANYIKSYQARRGVMLGCIEEAAYTSGFLKKEDLEKHIARLPNNFYTEYLKKIC